MRDEIASLIAPPEEARVVSGVVVDEVATGGTLFANALSMAAGRAALLDVLTEAAFEHTASLGARMAAGLRAAISRAELRWSVVPYGAHASYFFADEPPTDGAGSRANRGVWESRWWLGPTVSVAHSAEDVDRYVEVFDEFLREVT